MFFNRDCLKGNKFKLVVKPLKKSRLLLSEHNAESLRLKVEYLYVGGIYEAFSLLSF